MLSFIVVVCIVLLNLLRYRQFFFRRREHWASQPNQTDLDEAAFYSYAHDYLKERFEFFQNYTQEEQHEFVERMTVFIKGKRIVGMELLTIDYECLVLVSMPAIRITFGLDEYTFPNIKTIGVYPSIFYNDMIRAEVKGLTFASGVTYFSLQHLKEGNRTTADNLNLGLHEMAHAFKIFVDHYMTQYDKLHQQMETFMQHANVLAEMVEEGSIQYLRKYAGTNADEFFAVCIENFFEQPEKLREAMPNTYMNIARMLKQNPI